MKIQLEKCVFDDNSSYKIINIEKCCDEIQQNPLIDFQVNLFENSADEFGIALSESYTYYLDDYYTTDYRFYKINRCPFCGEQILIEIIREVDKTDEYLKLKAEVYDIRKKINKCDSKKKASLLEDKFQEKNTLLNNYHYNSSININIDEVEV